MRAVVIRELGTGPVVVDRPAPARAAGETLVRIAGACLAHLDRSVAGGSFPTTPPLPYVPCADGAGWVVSSDRHPAGALVWLRGGGLGVARDGCAAELVSAPDDAVHVAPPGTDPLLAACFFSPCTSAHTAVHVLGAVTAGQRVLVTGAAGSVGAVAVQLALAAGADVVASVGRPERTGDVPAGAHVVVGDPRLTGDAQADLLVDTIGGAQLADRLDSVRSGGRAVLVGYTAGPTVTIDLPRLMVRDVALLPLNMQRRAPAAFGVADDLLMRLGRDLTLPITTSPVDDVGAAWADLAGGRVAGRAVLTFASSADGGTG